MKKKKIWIITSFIILAILIISELFFRKRYQTFYYTPPIFEEENYLGYKFRAGYYIESPNRKIPINKYGYLGNDWNIEKDSNTYRICIIAACFGVGGIHIVDSNYYNFPELIGKELKHKGYKVEILNFSVPGEDRSLNLFQSIEYDVLKFDPDLILFEYSMPLTSRYYTRGNYKGWSLEYLQHDKQSRKRVEDLTDKLSEKKFLISVYNNVYLVKAIARNYMYRKTNELSTIIKCLDAKVILDIKGLKGQMMGSYTFEKSCQMIRDLKIKLANQDISFFLFQYGSSGNDINKTCKGEELPLLSLDCEFTEEMYYRKDSHINNLGQIEVKDRFVKIIEKLIPLKYK